MEKVPMEEFEKPGHIRPKRENVAFFMRPEDKQLRRIERIQNIENVLKENLDEIESVLSGEKESGLIQDKYFEIYAKLNDLTSIAERLGNADLLSRLECQAKLLEEIKSKKQRARFGKIKGWKSFKSKKN